MTASDDTRHESSNKDGGKECQNEKLVGLVRKVAKNMISLIGRKLISGDFNLTAISFPIKAMIPMSALEKALNSTCLFPLYL